MSTSWDIYHRHGAVITELVTHAEQTGNYESPWAYNPSVVAEFGDVAQILRELHHRWYSALTGAVSNAIEGGEDDLRTDVLHAFRAVVVRHKGLRRILEANEHHPAIAPLMRTERAMLTAAAGLHHAIDLPRAESVFPMQRPRQSFWNRLLVGATA